MSAEVAIIQGLCRHDILGYCSNHFWKLMKASGKDGLKDVFCLVWLAKRRALAEYHDLKVKRRLIDAGPEPERPWGPYLGDLHEICPDFRPCNSGAGVQCRYFFLEACLLRFPKCRLPCEDFLGRGDQKG